MAEISKPAAVVRACEIKSAGKFVTTPPLTKVILGGKVPSNVVLAVAASDSDLATAVDTIVANVFAHTGEGTAFRVEVDRAGPLARLTVEDDGPGFDPYQVDDPLDPENLTRPCGRGLFLMRHYMTWIHFNERGNAVLLCKCRTAVEV